MGGLTFADANNRYLWQPDRNNFEPRAGVAFQLTRKTVLRAGWGMYMVPWIGSGLQQAGFSQQTDVLTTLNGGFTFIGDIANPFPRGVAEAAGASGGVSTFMGQAIASTPLNRINGVAHRWQTGVQRELPGRWKLEVLYAGTKGYSLPITTNLNATPAKYLSTSPVRDQAAIDYLGLNISNPFRNLAPVLTTLGSASTVQRAVLLRPFPQFTAIAGERYDGHSMYHGLEVRVNRRFHQGFTISAAYTKSNLRESINLLNESDSKPEDRIGSDDRPQRFVTNGIFEIPFGRGRHWGNKWGRTVDTVLGGWQIGGIFMAQTGRPISTNNVYFNGDYSTVTANYDRKGLGGAIFDTSGFYFQDAVVMTNGVLDPNKQRRDARISLGSNIRTFPTMSSNLRGPAIVNLDFSAIKNMKVFERLKVQLRAESLNTLNYIQFGEPNVDPTNASFGIVTQTRNPTRQIQFAVKLVF